MPQGFAYPAKIEMWRAAQFDPGSWKNYRGDGTRFINVFAAAQTRCYAGLCAERTHSPRRSDGQRALRYRCSVAIHQQFHARLHLRLITSCAVDSVCSLVSVAPDRLRQRRQSPALPRHGSRARGHAAADPRASRVRIIRQFAHRKACSWHCLEAAQAWAWRTR